MDIAKLFFNARQRNAWQVFDLTQLVVKHHFIALITIAISVYLPVFLLFSAVFSFSTASLILWWLKPLLERPLLDYLAKRSFYQPTSTWSSITAIKKLKIIDIITMLTIRRLSIYRAYLAPIAQLENLQKIYGDERKNRQNILLHRNDHKQGFWLIFCVHIEFILTLLFMAIVYNFIPQGVSIDEQFFTSAPSLYQAEILYACCYLVAVIVIAPYYVTGGFLGYLNTRIDMEGWDLELAFKSIATRLRHITTVFILSIASVTFHSPPLSAQEIADEPINSAQNTASHSENNSAADNEIEIDEWEIALNERNKDIRKKVDDLYLEHQLIEKNTVWTPIWETDEPETDIDLAWFKTAIKAILLMMKLSALSDIITYLVWLFLAGLIVWMVYKLYQSGGFNWLEFSISQSKALEKPIEFPTFLSDIHNDKGPKNLLKAAYEANKKQAYRTALMYLLKHAFIYAQSFSNVLITKSMTEKECEAALVKALPVALHENYKMLFKLWIQQAWAHKDVNQQQVEAIISLFSGMRPEQKKHE